MVFFIELSTRKVHLGGCTRHPTAAWVAQQARNPAWPIQEGELSCCYRIRDRDAKCSPGFDAVFRSERAEIVRTPYGSPRANAVAERWVGTARRECLDHLLILSERRLLRVVTAFIAYYNERRAQQGLQQHCPVPLATRAGGGPVARRDGPGGIIQDFYRDAA